MNTRDTGTDSESTLIRGWVPQPNTRGTFDLAVSCAVTVFLCSWSSICVNVPTTDHSKRDLFWDKWHMFCLSMLGPEFIFMLALGQYMRAHASMKSFHDKGYKDWTTMHAFYADMGGFILQTRDWKPFPVDAKQLFYLIERGYVRYPEINKAMIDDKNKSDGLARFITSCQIIWFTLNVIARPTQNLAVTTIEITTIGFIFCTLGINFCWRNKPMDVSTAIVLNTDHTIHHILQSAEDVASQPYRLTPLDFVSREEWIATQLWQYNVNILRKLRVIRQRPKVRPVQRLSSFSFPKLPRRGSVITLCITLVYSAIFMAAWNFEFPSAAERLIWRICTSLSMGLTIVVGIVEVALPQPRNSIKEGASDIEGEGRKATLPIHGDRFMTGLLGRLANKRFNNSLDKDPALDVPLKSILFTQPICAVYTVCRLYVLLEDIIGLRAVPASAFQCVNWTVYWPHM
ncbi:uncharacterized protein Z518_02973 [Rhinocladiella mackenziei CBS 650.93]|uniref:Uncharacterized protein n=1 Tax=Rhinocladiella mackenziei CBS 650.93 TaxID=1442369 RepID=A0A0D2G190_9EURO|nr:uncharacterized protein Z518_02973 [Rhinocladiella mackenziei CBS 650.93]KIX08317.1 hypothetical protein Z518_02973 [Rhinocladiella mackenziei CBS 650.93]